MATSGSFNTNAVAWTYVTFNWNLVSKDVENNKSTINWNVFLYQEAGSVIENCDFDVVIDGTNVFSIRNKKVSAGQFGSGSVTLNHNEDGTKSFSVSMNGKGRFIFVAGDFSGTQTFELDSIPRASQIVSAADITLGNRVSIQWTPAAQNYKYKIKFALGNWSYTTDFILPNTTGAYTYTGFVIPLDVARQITNSKTGTMTATLYSYSSGGEQMGSESSMAFTVTVPASFAPIAKVAVSAVNWLALYSLNDIYIQGRSKVNVNFEGSEAQYGASIVSCSFVVLGKTYSLDNAGSKASDYITSSGSVEIKANVTDSRGYSTLVSKSIDVYAYSAPAVIPFSGNMVTVKRENGTQLRIEAGRKFSSLGGNNLCSLAYRCAKSGTALPSVWTEIISEDDAFDTVSILAAGVTLDEKSSYTIELKAEDALGEQGILTFAVSTEEIAFHLKNGGKGAAFGKYAEEDGILDIGWDAHFRKGINGAFVGAKSLSTTNFTITMTGNKQNVLVFGEGVCGVLNFNGTSTTWVGNGNVSCSTSGKVVSVTVPAPGSFVMISDYLLDIK